ncbi:alkaline phosphatase [candidate division KSB3 bacterium]|uniref:Alkaline phosphatase n=1 Tax=candidate division KSB3 bacterium TaxID=2044937 RepID=A0A9D5JWV2_9BACT|nr:alkaline phosphatase [candidate division KSB3 bacterium]MBD3325703.1 alkaline phosphatase [candidate division KSB3 bacterium]
MRGTQKSLSFMLVVVVSLMCIVPGLAQAQSPKYVFLFIGDGMGMPQRAAAEMFQSGDPNSPSLLLMDKFPVHGITTTHANDRFITGSAASSTAMACGIKTNIGYIGVDPNFNPVETIAEKAKKQGMKVAIISSVSIDHATPAAFYAHQESRSMYHEIAMQLANSDFDFFGGGGIKDPEGKRSKNPLGNVYDVAQGNGFTVVSDKADFMALPKDAGKVFAYNTRLPDGGALPYAMDTTADDISIVEFTQKAIELLDNDNGFFMMIEGGKIDWACHANDAVAAIKDTLAFDEAILAAYDFYEAHPEETLIVVTGDHECGGLTLGFAGTKYETAFDVLKDQKVSFQVFTAEIMEQYKAEHAGEANFEDMLPLLEEYFGLKVVGEGPLVLEDYELQALEQAFLRSMAGVTLQAKTDFLLYGGYDPFTMEVTHILNQKAGLAWTSFSHTGVPISTSAIGVGAETFNGFYDNTDIAKKMMSLMGLEFTVAAMQ